MSDEPATDVNAASPQVLEHLVGQRRVIERSKVALEAAWNDVTRFPHCLLCGPPGLGKSLLASVIAREMGVELKQVLGQTLDGSGALAGFLLTGKDRDVLFIDEADELKAHLQTTLYRAVEDKCIFLRTGLVKRRTQQIELKDFTLLLATNHEHSLVQPLRDRFRLILRFRFYDAAEIEEMLCRRVKGLRWEVEPEVLTRISAMARGTPRIALRLLEACRRSARAVADDAITLSHFEATLRLEGLDDLGLDEIEQQYLRLLSDADTPLPLNVLESQLGLPKRTIAHVVEPYLIRERLVTKERSQRLLTPRGIEHIRRTMEEP